MSMSIQRLASAEADLFGQLALLAAWTAIWYTAIPLISKHYVRPLVQSRPWKDQWVECCRRMFKEGFFVEFRTSDEVLDGGCLAVSILCQHAVGATLSMPAALGFRGQVSGALARHGALCEAGWELSDSIERAWALALGGEEGRAKHTPAVCIVMTLHHCLGLSMILPMNLMYGDNSYYHELIFLLQGAASFGLMAQFFGFTLDVSAAKELKQMQGITGCYVLLMIWSRCVRFGYVAYHMVSTLHADGQATLVMAAYFALSTMGLFNLLVTIDAIKKLHKFVGMSVPESGEGVQTVLKKVD